MKTEAPVEYKTCKITLVVPGSSDQVIKVYPAEHESEKIWLDHTPGIERWEAVKRFLNNHAARGERVPKPAPYHSSPNNLAVRDLAESDIPTVRLDGAVLEGPPVEQKIKDAQPALLDKKQAEFESKMDARMSRLEEAIFALSRMSEAKESDAKAEAKKSSRKKED